MTAAPFMQNFLLFAESIAVAGEIPAPMRERALCVRRLRGPGGLLPPFSPRTGTTLGRVGVRSGRSESQPKTCSRNWRRTHPQRQADGDHGDYCLPNVLLFAGRLTGALDVGHFGRGDPGFDIVSADGSGRRNPGRIGNRFLGAYCERPDPDRIRWLTLLRALLWS